MQKLLLVMTIMFKVVYKVECKQMFNLGNYTLTCKKIHKSSIKTFQTSIEKIAKAWNNFQLVILGYKLKMNLKKTQTMQVNLNYRNQFLVLLVLLKKLKNSLSKNKKSQNFKKPINKKKLTQISFQIKNFQIVKIKLTKLNNKFKVIKKLVINKSLNQRKMNSWMDRNGQKKNTQKQIKQQTLIKNLISKFMTNKILKI